VSRRFVYRPEAEQEILPAAERHTIQHPSHMPSQYTSSPRRWAAIGICVALEAVVLIALLFTWPSVAEGAARWLSWLVVAGVNIVLARVLIISGNRV
jgi:hypothetical protein